MANHHLRNKALSLKAKGVLSLMLSLPEDWDYTTRGLSCICKDGVDSIRVGHSSAGSQRLSGSGTPPERKWPVRCHRVHNSGKAPASGNSASCSGKTYIGKSNAGNSHAGFSYAGDSHTIKYRRIKYSKIKYG